VVCDGRSVCFDFVLTSPTANAEEDASLIVLLLDLNDPTCIGTLSHNVSQVCALSSQLTSTHADHHASSTLLVDSSCSIYQVHEYSIRRHRFQCLLSASTLIPLQHWPSFRDKSRPSLPCLVHCSMSKEPPMRFLHWPGMLVDVPYLRCS
jgi:hypothetical protein